MSFDLPTVSVVVPAFNRRDTIRRAVDSALSQTHKPFEVIVVDDASSDETRDVVTAIPDNRVKLVSHKKNCGGGAARNTGIMSAQGAYIAFLDADDSWLPHKLERQIGKVSNNLRTICFTNLEFIRGNPGRVFWNSRGPYPGERLSKYTLIEGQAIQTSTLLMETEVARAILFDPRLRRHQDLDFVLRAERDGYKFEYIDEALVRYSLGDDTSVSRGASATPTLDWIGWAGDLLDREAKTALMLDQVVPRISQANRLAALKIILGAVFGRSSTTRRIGRAATHLLPTNLRRALVTKLKGSS